LVCKFLIKNKGIFYKHFIQTYYYKTNKYEKGKGGTKMTVYIRPTYRRLPNFERRLYYPENLEIEENQVLFPMDVCEKNDDFIITAMLPGLKTKDVEIQIANETVSIKGEFQSRFDKDANYILQEIPSGKFFRSIVLPGMLDASKADAQMENGVLTVRVPKAEESKPKKIKITVAKK